MVAARPFVKWAGGKRQLLDVIKTSFPREINNEITSYVEPFCGGGAVLFYILHHYNNPENCYNNMQSSYIFDINEQLINTYLSIKDRVKELIKLLKKLQEDFYVLSEKEKEETYFESRKIFNQMKKDDSCDILNQAAYFIFLNKTCFNGVYRVNRKGEFNQSYNKLKLPVICDKNNLIRVSQSLQRVNIRHGDYQKSEPLIDENTFVYLDPPYRKMGKIESHNRYHNNFFNDKDQVELAKFCQLIHKKKAFFMLSNSDPKNVDPNDNFFEEHYSDFNVRRVNANRVVNRDASKRKAVKELLITNY